MIEMDWGLLADVVERIQNDVRLGNAIVSTDYEDNHYFEEALRLLSLRPNVVSRNEEINSEWFTVGEYDLYQWNRHKNFMIEKLGLNGLSIMTKIGIDTDRIMDELPNPRVDDDENFDCRGLVVGSVQSGKTANFTSLIAKAVDAGYNLIIIFAGLIDDLRTQTQIRLNQTLFGDDNKTDFIDKAREGNEWYSITDENEDFQEFTPSTEPDTWDYYYTQVIRSRRPKVFVVKKNTEVLDRLLRVFFGDSGIEILDRNWNGKQRVLVIDDEADHASVDTGIINKFTRDELIHHLGMIGLSTSGTKRDMVERYFSWARVNQDDAADTALPDENASQTNLKIRELLNSFSKIAYVGYTATPFANLLTIPWPDDEGLGDTLYPRNFIASIEPPEDYIGAEEIFSLHRDEQERQYVVNTTLNQENDEIDEEAINRHLLSTNPEWDPIFHYLPESLANAIGDFIVTGVIRELRGQDKHHHTMLINTSHLSENQDLVQNKVQQCIDYWKELLHYRTGDNDGDSIRDFLKQRFLIIQPNLSHSNHTWDEVLERLDTNLETNYIDTLAEVASINYRSGQSLEYLEAEKRGGLRIIAIGGNRLSRGLTLEGLTVSYFARTSQYYDTLLQMGRWFGYRPEYDDLVKVHMSGRLINWFSHLANVENELRADIARFDVDERSPRELAVRIMTHEFMRATGRVRPEHSRRIQVGYDASILRTRKLNQNIQVRRTNIQNASEMFSRLNDNFDDAHSIRLWKNISAEWILSFLRGYQTVDDVVGTFRIRDVISYIAHMNGENELNNWSVGLHIPGSNRQNTMNFGNHEVGTVNRGPYKGTPVIGILEHTFEIVAVDLENYPECVMNDGRLDKNLMFDLRDETNGLILAYLIDKDSTDSNGLKLFTNPSEHGLAIIIVLPKSETGADLRREYIVLDGVDYD